jgi:carbonic anhydrase
LTDLTDSSRRTFLRFSAAAIGAAALSGCASAGQSRTAATPAAAISEAPVADGKEALQRLMDGNERFAGNHAEHLDEGEERRIAVSKEQHPFATILGCVDSRVPAELVFDRGLGDLVVVRSAAEVLDKSVIGSLEFGVAELKTPLLMVLGHQRCGALDATIKALDGRMADAAGDIDFLVEALEPAVRQVAGKPGDRLANAVLANVELVLQELRKSPVLGPAEKAGKVLLVGAYYELDTGRVLLN